VWKEAATEDKVSNPSCLTYNVTVQCGTSGQSLKVLKRTATWPPESLSRPQMQSFLGEAAQVDRKGGVSRKKKERERPQNPGLGEGKDGGKSCRKPTRFRHTRHGEENTEPQNENGRSLYPGGWGTAEKPKERDKKWGHKGRRKWAGRPRPRSKPGCGQCRRVIDTTEGSKKGTQELKVGRKEPDRYCKKNTRRGGGKQNWY